MQWEIQETSEVFHFSPLRLLCQLVPSSLAWIIASPLTSLCFWPHLLQSSLKTVMPLLFIDIAPFAQGTFRLSQESEATQWAPLPLTPPLLGAYLFPPLHDYLLC